MGSGCADSGVGRVFRDGSRVQWGKSSYRSVNAQNGGFPMEVIAICLWCAVVALFILAVADITN